MVNRTKPPPPPAPAAAPALPNLRDFAELVDLMRRHQRTFFQTRNTGSLAQARRLEAQVDQLTRTILLQPASAARASTTLPLPLSDEENS